MNKGIGSIPGKIVKASMGSIVLKQILSSNRKLNTGLVCTRAKKLVVVVVVVIVIVNNNNNNLSELTNLHILKI